MKVFYQKLQCNNDDGFQTVKSKSKRSRDKQLKNKNSLRTREAQKDINMIKHPTMKHFNSEKWIQKSMALNL